MDGSRLVSSCHRLLAMSPLPRAMWLQSRRPVSGGGALAIPVAAALSALATGLAVQQALVAALWQLGLTSSLLLSVSEAAGAFLTFRTGSLLLEAAAGMPAATSCPKASTFATTAGVANLYGPPLRRGALPIVGAKRRSEDVDVGGQPRKRQRITEYVTPWFYLP
eukprot:TRINITY_DN105578_c0_g1_i1.p1 TRINITY_DN105578_c0_g1~~TRINITY_DN105578_c0_g1_i1.p1  ORF type:complete len:165 (+),score=20.22 TRINITY_DN105578_c0_g1_i1:80-574(+)